MNSQIFCSLALVVGTLIYLLSTYTVDMIDNYSLLDPIVIATNKQLQERPISKGLENAQRSPLYKSLKIRYNQVINGQDVLLTDGTFIRESEKDVNVENDYEEDEYWRFTANLFNNKTFNHIYSSEGEENLDYYYILNINKDIYSNDTFNPQFGQITVSRFQKSYYLKGSKDDDNSSSRKESRQSSFEESYKSPHQIQVCYQSFVPGVITQIAISQHSKDQVAVVYRVLTEAGAVSRIRVFNKVTCQNDFSYSSNNTSQGKLQFEKTRNSVRLYQSILSQDKVTDELFEDFILEGTFSITALSFLNETTITYARYMDLYQYRILSKNEDNLWVESHKGPFINRKVDKIYMCAGLHYVDMGGKSPNLVVISLKGTNLQEVRLIVEFQHYVSNITGTNLTEASWVVKKKIYDRSFPIHYAPNIYNSEYVPHVATFTDTHRRNKIVCLFGSIFLALDWSEQEQNILVFETYRLNSQRIDLLQSFQDNSNFIIYDYGYQTMTQVIRDKAESDQVMEDWYEINLQNLPAEMKGKKVLGLLYEHQDKEDTTIFALFEDGILASIKVDNSNSEYRAAMIEMEEVILYDILVPFSLPLFAILALYFKRRRNQLALEQEADRMPFRGPIMPRFPPVQQPNGNHRPPPSPQRLENLNPLPGDLIHPMIDEFLIQDQQQQQQQNEQQEILNEQQNDQLNQLQQNEYMQEPEQEDQLQQQQQQEENNQEMLQGDLINLAEIDFDNRDSDDNNQQ